jgi:small subunit ribosomal protein S6
MRPYETMIIFDPEAADTAVNATLDRGLEILRSAGATPGRVDRWGRRPFAYELRHRREGYYVVVEFSGEPAAAAELDRHLHLADEVLRHKVVRLPDEAVGAAKPAPPTAVAAGR